MGSLTQGEGKFRMKNTWVLAKALDDWVKQRIMITTITSVTTTSLSFINP